jgi:hypothetical protein
MKKKGGSVSVPNTTSRTARPAIPAGRLSADVDGTEVEKALKALGAEVVRDDEAKGKPIIKVYLYRADVTDAALRALREAGLLHTLGFGMATAKDGARPESTEGVIRLDLSSTAVTGAGLKELGGLKNLQTLGLSDTKVTGTGLAELAGLKRLKELHLTAVTDVGLKELAGLKSLQVLKLNNTKETDMTELQKALPNCTIEGGNRIDIGGEGVEVWENGKLIYYFAWDRGRLKAAVDRAIEHFGSLQISKSLQEALKDPPLEGGSLGEQCPECGGRNTVLGPWAMVSGNVCSDCCTSFYLDEYGNPEVTY